MVERVKEDVREIKTAQGDALRLAFYHGESNDADDAILIRRSSSKLLSCIDSAADQRLALQLSLASFGNVGCITIDPRDDGTFGGLIRSCVHGLAAMLAYAGQRWQARKIVLVSTAEACLAANLLLMKRKLGDSSASDVQAALAQHVRLVVNICGLSDLTTLVHWCRYNGCSESDVNEALACFGSASKAMLAAAGTRESVPAMANSPLFYVRRGLPGFVLIHNSSSRTAPFQQSKALHTFLRRKDVNADLFLYDGHNLASYSGVFVNRLRARLKQNSAASPANSMIVLVEPAGDKLIPHDLSSAPYDIGSDGWIDPIDVHFDKVMRRRLRSNILGAQVEIGVYLPPSYTDASFERFPVIYWLPGADQPFRAGFFFVEMLDAAIKRAAAHESIVVLLQRPSEKREEFARVGWAGFDNFFTVELVPFMDREFKTLAERAGRAVEGVCSGGNAALRLALSFPAHFSAVSAIAPYWGRWTERFTKTLGPDPAMLSPRVKEDRPRMRIIAGTKDPSWSGARYLAAHYDAMTWDVQFLSVTGLGRDAIGVYDRLGADAFSFFNARIEVARMQS
jgi:hypothetical protein